MSQILRVQGALPYLAALFLNAFTDLGHKVIIQNTVFKIYDDGLQIMLTAVVNALILLPYILLFSPSGYLSDKFPKNDIMRYAAFAGVVITLLITFSYYMGWFAVAFGLTFVLALQSAIYSPAKYGYIKELLGERHISAGNAAVQAATTVAILSGIIFYTVLFEKSLDAPYASEADILRQIAPVGFLLVIGSLAEWAMTFRLPQKSPVRAAKRFDLRRYKNGYYLRKNLKAVTRKRDVWGAIVALAVFWSVSQVVLAIFGAYAKTDLGIDNTVVVQGLMALAAIGIVAGSVFAAAFSRNYIKLGLVPLGALGLALAVALLPRLHDMAWIAFTFVSFGFFAGMFIVPLNAFIQKSTPRAHLGTVLAGNNFVQHGLMFTFLMLTTLSAYAGIGAKTLFGLMFVICAVMALLLMRRYIDLFIWAVLELVLSLRYKIQYRGVENLPKEGALLLLGNHISWIDWMLVQFPLERRIRFLMERSIYEWRLINPVMRLGKVIPISSRASKEGFAKARRHIADREVVGLFPEGAISHSGEMGKFYGGFELIAGQYNGKITPCYIDGIYGSLFSRSKTRFCDKRSGLRRVVTVTFGTPMPLQSGADEVKAAIESIREANAAQQTEVFAV